MTEYPDSDAPPVQRKPRSGAEPNPIGHFANLGDLNADGAETGSWRWARKRPAKSVP